MKIPQSLHINTEEDVLKYIKVLSSFSDDEAFIEYSKKLKSIVKKTGDLKHQVYFQLKYSEFILAREQKIKESLSINNSSISKSTESHTHNIEETNVENNNLQTDLSNQINICDYNPKQVEEELRNRIIELEKQVKDKDYEVSKHKSEIISLNKEYSYLKNKNNELKKQINDFKSSSGNSKQEKIINPSQSNKQLKKENKELHEEIEKLRRENIAIVSNLKNPKYIPPRDRKPDETKKLIEDLKNKSEAKDIRIKTLEFDNEKLKRDLKKSKEDKGIENTNIETLEILLREVKQEKKKLEDENKNLEKEKDEYRRKLENCQKELNKFKSINTSPMAKAKTLPLDESEKISYKGGIAEDGSTGFSNERRENGRMGSLSSFDNYNDDFNEIHPNEYY